MSVAFRVRTEHIRLSVSGHVVYNSAGGATTADCDPITAPTGLTTPTSGPTLYVDSVQNKQAYTDFGGTTHTFDPGSETFSPVGVGGASFTTASGNLIAHTLVAAGMPVVHYQPYSSSPTYVVRANSNPWLYGVGGGDASTGTFSDAFLAAASAVDTPGYPSATISPGLYSWTDLTPGTAHEIDFSDFIAEVGPYMSVNAVYRNPSAPAGTPDTPLAGVSVTILWTHASGLTYSLSLGPSDSTGYMPVQAVDYWLGAGPRSTLRVNSIVYTVTDAGGDTFTLTYSPYLSETGPGAAPGVFPVEVEVPGFPLSNYSYPLRTDASRFSDGAHRIDVGFYAPGGWPGQLLIGAGQTPRTNGIWTPSGTASGTFLGAYSGYAWGAAITPPSYVPSAAISQSARQSGVTYPATDGATGWIGQQLNTPPPAFATVGNARRQIVFSVMPSTAAVPSGIAFGRDAHRRPAWAFASSSSLYYQTTKDGGSTYSSYYAGSGKADPNLLIDRRQNKPRLVWADGAGTLYTSAASVDGERGDWAAGTAIAGITGTFPVCAEHPTDRLCAALGYLDGTGSLVTALTYDGGATWAANAGQVATGLSFATSGRAGLCWLGETLCAAYWTGSVVAVKTSPDRGRTWGSAVTITSSAAASLSLTAFAGTLYLLATVGTAPALWRSGDAGATWAARPAPPGLAAGSALGVLPRLGRLLLWTLELSDDDGGTWTATH